MYEKIKHWYETGKWTAEMVHNAYVKGVITEEQYETIIAEE